LFKKVSEWQNGGVNKQVTYLFDYFDYSLFRFVRIISSECSLTILVLVNGKKRCE
jgi:hypothetical protein